MIVGAALAAAGIDPREARLLMAAVTGFSEANVFAFQERAIPEKAEKLFFEYISRRKSGEPIAYILGRQEFYGIEFEVGPGALIPRHETELIIDLALQLEFDSIADLGTGSGNIALVLKRERPKARVVATDSSAEALVVARRNAAKHGLDIDFRHGSWLEPLAGERFDVIVANPPYVVTGDPHLRHLHYEPHLALVGGADGLDGHREIAAGVHKYLRPGGHLLVEHGMGQEKAVREIFDRAGLEEIADWPDLARIPRVTGGKVK